MYTDAGWVLMVVTGTLIAAKTGVVGTGFFTYVVEAWLGLYVCSPILT